MLAAEGTREEALCCLLVPLGTEQEVDRLASAVDRSVQVAPLPADPDVRLINVPRPAARTQVGAHPLLQLRGEALDPAVQGCVIHRHAAIGEHGLEVAVADRKLQVPARIHRMDWADRTERRGNASKTANSFLHPSSPSEFGHLIQRKSSILQSKLTREAGRTPFH